MTKFLSLMSSVFEGVGKIFDFLNTKALKNAGRAEKENEILKKENEILEKQRDNDVHDVNSADGLWDKWDNDK